MPQEQQQKSKKHCLQTLNIVDTFHLCINIIHVMLWAVNLWQLKADIAI